MKKMVWVVVGLVVLITMGIVIRMTNIEHGISNIEGGGKHAGDTGNQNGESLASTTLNGGADGNVDDATPSSRSTAAGESDEGVASTIELSGPVKALLSLDEKKHNYPSLLSAINDLDDDISATDLSALKDMLNFPNDRFPEKMRPIEINAVKNDVLDKLLRQKQLPEGLGLQMVEMAGNADNDPVWRDYCIQFCPTAWERIDAEYRIANTEQGTLKESNKVEDELTAIHDAMFSALDERDETLAGTSLIGLELLSRTHDEFDRELIVTKATEIASDEMASAASRLTALRVAADLTTKNTESFGNANYDETVEAARSLAQTGETVLLRSAAIVTLGEIGTEADRELLVSYTTDPNQQIYDAAKMALDKRDREPSIEPAVVSQTTSELQITEKLPPVLIN